MTEDEECHNVPTDPRYDACAVVVNSVQAFFFFIYAFNNPDSGACFAREDSKLGKSSIPVSVTATLSSDTVYATGYVDISFQF